MRLLAALVLFVAGAAVAEPPLFRASEFALKPAPPEVQERVRALNEQARWRHWPIDGDLEVGAPAHGASAGSAVGSGSGGQAVGVERKGGPVHVDAHMREGRPVREHWRRRPGTANK